MPGAVCVPSDVPNLSLSDASGGGLGKCANSEKNKLITFSFSFCFDKILELNLWKGKGS